MAVRLTAIAGDITDQDVEAIVNAANETCLGGGGVDGAIHRAAGRELLAACRALPEVSPRVRCPTGRAVITPGFHLKARWVIHTVGPVYGTSGAAALLASAYRTSLALAESQRLERVAFPAISCGAYRYPLEEAATIAAGVCREKHWALEEIRFVLFDAPTHRAFGRALFGDAWR